MYAYENNPNGICEDAPCCGCCGPQGDGRIYDEPPEPDDDYYPEDAPECVHCGEDATQGTFTSGHEVTYYCDECGPEGKGDL